MLLVKTKESIYVSSMTLEKRKTHEALVYSSTTQRKSRIEKCDYHNESLWDFFIYLFINRKIHTKDVANWLTEKFSIRKYDHFQQQESIQVKYIPWKCLEAILSTNKRSNWVKMNHSTMWVQVLSQQFDDALLDRFEPICPSLWYDFSDVC